MKKILITIIMLSTFVFAEDFQFVVENSTMVEAYFNLFNSIAALFQSNDYLDLLRLAFLIGGFFVFAGGVLTSFSSSSDVSLPVKKYFIYCISGVALLTLVFSAKSTMWVTTNNIPSFCSTASPSTGFAVKMPGVLAYLFTTTNAVGRGLTQLAESAFSVPSANGNASMSDSGGYLGALKQTIKVLSLDPNKVTLHNSTSGAAGSDFKNLWSTFFNSCVFAPANNQGVEGNNKITELYKTKDLYTWSKDYLTNFSYSSSPDYKMGDYYVEWMGGYLTCNQYFNTLEESTTQFMDNFACTMPLANGGVLELITGNSGGGSVSQLADIARQAALVSTIKKSSAINSVGIVGTQFASAKTTAENNINNLSAASYMAEMLPYLQMTMRAIVYGFFPFVFVVVLLPGGGGVLKQYLQSMIWIELWSPTAAVVNMFVNLQVKDKLGGLYSSDGINLMTSVDMLSEANIIAGVGAMLYLSIPALTWLILRGSAQMLGSVASGISNRFAANLTTETQARDKALMKASSQTGKSISETINQLEQLDATNKFSESAAFQSSGGMSKLLDVKRKMSEGKNKYDINNILSQDYVKNQEVQGEKKAAETQGDTEAYNENGGFDSTKNSSYIKTATDMQTTNKNVADAGSKDAVAGVQSNKNSAGFKTDKKTFDSYSTNTVSTSDFEKRKEDIEKTLKIKAGIEKTGQDTKDFYKKEATQSLIDRKANLRKIDADDDNKISSEEEKSYSKDVSTKAISDQNSLKEKNRRLEENAQKMLHSKNADVRETAERASKAFQGSGSLASVGAAVQSSISTKEQQYTTDEKSEYIDRMEQNKISGTEKAKVQVQKDVENISKTESETISYGNFIKEKMDGIDSYKKVEDNYYSNFKKDGMSDEKARISAKNATLSAHANNGFKNSDYTKDVLDNNISNIQNNMNEKLEKKALEKGVLSKDDFALVKREKSLEKQIAGLEAQRKNGALSPSLSMTLHSANRKLANTKEELADVRNNLSTFASTDADGQKIIQDAKEQTSTVITNMEKMGVIKVDENGIKVADSFSKLDTNNLSEIDKGNLRTMKGNLEGNKIETIGADGREYKVITDIANNKITNYSSAKMGYENISADRYDKGYAFSEMTSGKYMKETAIASSVVNTVKTGISYGGLAFGVAGKLPLK